MADAFPQAPAWAVLVTALAAVAALVNHTRFHRAGAGSTWSRRYFDAGLPREFRNLGFAQRPAGITLAMWTLVLAYGWLPAQDVFDVVVALLIVASLVPLAITVKRLYRPPRKAKPAWLVEEEARQAR
ncbi:hypothetical protein ACIBQ1_38440 [Nonomuraea sp. NPDC050153]|uniref:hypothetical protein n=1 Tax=Nonomuraea sp. NPDC050153 TaxID=3364359 RepID=UPI0037A19A40